MARTITTVTTTVKGKIPYHFICNYCGCRNDKLTTITGVSVGGRENVGGALRDLHDEPKRYREKIEAYRERLRAGDNLLGGKYDALQYSLQSLVSLELDGKCAHCGKTQAWAITPDAPYDSWRAGCLTMVGFLFGGLALFLVGAIANLNAVLSATFMALGGLVEVSAIVGGLILHFMRNRRARKARIAEIAAAPNDPDKLPVIEV